MKPLFFLLCIATTMSAVGIASAYSPPVIRGIHAWNVGSTTAEIRMLFRSDQSCRKWFELSTHRDLSGAKRVNEGSVGRTETGADETRLSGLTPNTAYYYRAFLEFHSGRTLSEVHSGIDSFHTIPGH